MSVYVYMIGFVYKYVYIICCKYIYICMYVCMYVYLYVYVTPQRRSCKRLLLGLIEKPAK